MRTLFTAATLALCASLAFAHSKVDTTLPKDGAVLQAAPEVVALNFGAKIRLTKVELTAPDAKPEDMDLSAHKSFETEFELPLTDAGAGLYQIDWRGLSADGHAVQGSFSFQVE